VHRSPPQPPIELEFNLLPSPSYPPPQPFFTFPPQVARTIPHYPEALAPLHLPIRSPLAFLLCLSLPSPSSPSFLKRREQSHISQKPAASVPRSSDNLLD
jgi:hypothetical protein